MKNWSERTAPEDDSRVLAGKFMEINATIPEAKVLAINPPPITGMSITGGFEGYLQSRTGESAVQVAEVANRLVAAASQRPELTGVQTTLHPNVQQARKSDG